MSSEDTPPPSGASGEPQVAAPPQSSSSDESDGNTYSISQTLFDALTARGFSENAIKKSIVSGCVDEATCTQWIQMHEGHPELDTPLVDGVEVIIKAKRVLTEAEREAKVRELQEKVRRNKEEERMELQRKERERLEMGRKMAQMKSEMEDVRRKMDVEEARREKAADLEARRRIKIQLAADRYERKGHSKDEALTLAEKEFEEAAAKARAEAADKLAQLQGAAPSAASASGTAGGAAAWDLGAITAASSQESKLDAVFAGELALSAQSIVEGIFQHVPAEQTHECVRTLRLILGNIAADPFDMKKRTLCVSNKTFRDSILPVDAAAHLLRWCGFDLSTDAASNQTLCLSTVVMRRLHQALALLAQHGGA